MLFARRPVAIAITVYRKHTRSYIPTRVGARQRVIHNVAVRVKTLTVAGL